MRPHLLLPAALAACSEYEFKGEADVLGPDDEDTGCPICPVETGDSAPPVDTAVDGPADCDVATADAGDVSITEECTGTGTGGEVTDPWNATIEWQYTSAGSGVIVMPAVGNLTDDNGDGRVDEDDIPDIAFSTWSSNTLVALSGADASELFEISGFDGQGGTTIADVDNDGEPEVVAFQTGYRIAAVDASGAVEWTSAAFSMMAYPQPAVADLDGDGDVEVIGDSGIVDGADGSTVAQLAGMTNSWRTPVAADIDQDGTQEVILANKVFDHNGNLEWSNPGTGSGNFSAVADTDGDPEGEVFFVSSSTAYLHDSDGTLLDSWTIPGTNPGPPAVADFDGDGEVEIAIPANTQISVWDFDGTMLWTATINDTSGLAGCSGYDVDGDGAYEVLYADQEDLRIYDGATGTVRYQNGSHSSGTVWEYPVVADVDNDGSAEIVIASNGTTWRGITVFGHSGDGWPKSGTTWGTHDFAVTNLNADGSVPSPPDPSWQVYNVFRARPSVDDPSAPDLVVDWDEICVASCETGPIKVSWQVWNQGGADVDAGIEVVLYAVDGGAERVVRTATLGAIVAGTSLEGDVFELGPSDLGDGGFVLRVDPADALRECDETNNEYAWTDSICG